MIALAVKDAPSAHTIVGMNTYQTDSRGKRIAWARKQAGITGAELAKATGVRNVTISYIENDHRELSLPLLQKIAQTADVTVGFLLSEIDYAKRIKAQETIEAITIFENASSVERERLLSMLRNGQAQIAAQERKPVHLSPESEKATLLIDDAPPAERARMLAVLRTLAAQSTDDCARDDSASELNTQRRQLHNRLVHRDKIRQSPPGERSGS